MTPHQHVPSPAVLCDKGFAKSQGIGDLLTIGFSSFSARLQLIDVLFDPFEIIGPSEIIQLRRNAMKAGSSLAWDLPLEISAGNHFVALTEEIEEDLVQISVTMHELIPRLRAAVQSRKTYPGFMQDWICINRMIERYHAYLRVRGIYNARLVTSIRSGQMQATKQQAMFHATFSCDHAPGLSQNARRDAEDLLLDLLWQIHCRQALPPEGWPVSWFERMLAKKRKKSRKKCNCHAPQVCEACSPFKRTLAAGYYKSNAPDLMKLLSQVETENISLPPTELSAYKSFNPTLKG